MSVKSWIDSYRREKQWSLECWIMGILGMAMIWQSNLAEHLNVIQETIILVVFLGGLMGITRIPFPSKFAGKSIPLYCYPLISGIISGFMDSFLVLLLVGAIELEGNEDDKFKFRALNMIAALIGGLTFYFGEVYMLPLALQYGQRYWYSMLPIVPPVMAYLALLAYLTSRLKIKVVGTRVIENGNGEKHKNNLVNKEDYFKFGAAIALLLITHNGLLCLGVLFLYAFILGEGEDLIDVMKTETEVGVMLLLVLALVIAEPIKPYLADWSGYWAFFPSAVNGVLTGAVYPTSGDMWFDAHVLSTAVLITPISSLVGVMLFKTFKEWKSYIIFALPLTIAWFLISALWFFGGPWNLIKPSFEDYFGAPQLQTTKTE